MAVDAPAVRYPVGRSARLAGVLGGVWAAGAAAASWVCFLAPARTSQAQIAILLIACLGVTAVGCLVFWRSQRPGLLVWDGERWGLATVSGERAAGEYMPQVRMDVQLAMLLRLQPRPAGRRAVWLWVEAAHEPARWHLLRCALYSSAPPRADEPVEGTRA
jgi:hypothetical protein